MLPGYRPCTPMMKRTGTAGAISGDRREISLPIPQIGTDGGSKSLQMIKRALG